MELSRNSVFLITTYESASQIFSVEIRKSFPDSLKEWDTLTRISPIWGVHEFGTHSVKKIEFTGLSNLIFMGPVRPATVLADLPSLPKQLKSPVRIWIGLGAFNLIAHCQKQDSADVLIKWAKKKNIPFESWALNNRKVLSIAHSKQVPVARNWHEQLAKFAKSKPPPELAASVAEYCALMASALTRSAEVAPNMIGMLASVHGSICSFITAAKQSPSDVPKALALLTNVNSGLSRFSSQAFSGISPILLTESHFWYHSLLGVFVANVALAQLNDFVFRKLGRERIAARLEKLEKKTDNVPDFSALDSSNDIFFGDHLSSIPLSKNDNAEPLIPLITFYSGRDGFKSHLYTLSAPIATISACNSLRWSLITVTHEISHVFIKSVISLLYPDIQDEKQLRHALGLLKGQRLNENWLDNIRRYLLQAVISMENEETHEFVGHTVQLDLDRLKQMLDSHRGEVEEVMAHVFDFLYFYRQDYQKYIQGIWLSWGVIPNISNRVPEYVMRTLCATLSKHLRRGPGMATDAREDVLRVLTALPDATHPQSYSSQAISHIKHDWDRISAHLSARMPIVRIVRAFLYSDTFSGKLWAEQFSSGAAGEREGYTSRPGILDESRISNPLLFLDQYTTSTDADTMQSVWMLNTLAFNVEEVQAHSDATKS